MPDYPQEPAVLRVARAAALMLPFGRSSLIHAVARITGTQRPFVANVGGHSFPIELSDRVSRTLYLYGSFEPIISALLPRLIAPGDTVIDAGANFGYFTVLAAAAAGPCGKVFAFEPDPRNIARLATVLSLNHLANVQTIAEGLFDRTGNVGFFLAGAAEDNLGVSSIVAKEPERTQIQIPITTLAAFADTRAIERIDLVKMDIEGAEFEALAGAQPLLDSRRIRRLLIETHLLILGQDKARAIVDRFAAAGYHAYLVREESTIPAAGIAGFLTPLPPGPWTGEMNPHWLFSVDDLSADHG